MPVSHKNFEFTTGFSHLVDIDCSQQTLSDMDICPTGFKSVIGDWGFFSAEKFFKFIFGDNFCADLFDEVETIFRVHRRKETLLLYIINDGQQYFRVGETDN